MIEDAGGVIKWLKFIVILIELCFLFVIDISELIIEHFHSDAKLIFALLNLFSRRRTE